MYNVYTVSTLIRDSKVTKNEIVSSSLCGKRTWLSMKCFKSYTKSFHFFLNSAHLISNTVLFRIWSMTETHISCFGLGQRTSHISLYLCDSSPLYLNHPPKMDDLSDTQSCPHFLFFCPGWPMGTCHYRWSIFSPCKSPSTTVARPSRASRGLDLPCEHV